MQPEFHEFSYSKSFAKSQVKEALKHIRLSKKRGLPQLMLKAPRPGKCIVVGAAPSAALHLDEIRAYAEDKRNLVFSVNETHDWLIERGIVPHGAVLFEVSKELNHCYTKPHPEVTYYISSMCHPSQYRMLLGHKMVVWHPWSDVIEHQRAMEEYPAPFMVGGGSTTFLRTLVIAQHLGMSDFELYGVDSSFDADSHLSGMSGDNGPPLDVQVNYKGETRTFRSFAYLIRQADEFRDYIEKHHHKFRMRVHGDGLLPHVHRSYFPQMYQENA